MWIQYAVECGYVDRKTARRLYADYDLIIAMLVRINSNPDQWSL